MRVRSFAVVVCFLSLFVLSAHGAAAQAAGSSPGDKPAYTSDPKFEAAIAEAKHFVARRQYAFAVDSYKKADKIAGGQCLSCMVGIYNSEISEGDFKPAASTAVAMEAMATSPVAKSVAEYRQANAIYLSAGDKPKPEKLEAAHRLLQEAIGNFPKNAAALYLDGGVLARLGKMDEAKAAFNQCLSCVTPNDPARLRAQHFAEDPELSLHKMAPPFEVTAMDGTKFNLDAMGGRVVLIDFWATWCGPCNREIPHMQSIAKEYADQPFVMISVSVDKDEAKWKEFLAKHEMTWEQYRDGDGKLGDEFGVTTIPRYFTIDSDGVLTSVMVDEGSDVEGKLKKLFKKAREAQKQTAAAAGAEHPTGN